MRSRLPFLALVGALSIGLLLHTRWYLREWADDAYISFRYSRNLWEGRGAVWNEGERLEGITNALWAALLAPASQVDILLVAKVLGCTCTVGALVLLAEWLRDRGAGLAATAAACSTLVLLPWAPTWSMMGLETAAVLFVVTLAWTRFGRDSDFPWSALGATLAPLLRPDAVLVPLLLVAARVAGVRTRPLTRVDARGAALLAGVGAATAAGKLWYYGALLPNTFYVKKAGFPYTLGWSYLANFLFAHSVLFGVVVLLGVFLALRTELGRLPAALSIAYGLGAGVFTGGDFFANYRFFVPALPAIGAAVWAASTAIPRVGGLLAGALVVATAQQAPIFEVWGSQRPPQRGGFAGTNLPKRTATLTRAPTFPLSWVGGNPIPPAFVLAFVPDDVAVAYSDIGVTGYLNDQPVVDLFGLTDPVIARRHEESLAEQVAYVRERCGVVILRPGAATPLIRRLDRELATDPAFLLVFDAGRHRAYARPNAWTGVSVEALDARIRRLVALFPRSPGLYRQVMELVGLTGLPVDLSPLVERMDRWTGGNPGARRLLAEGRCWGEGRCEGIRRASWVTGDPRTFRFEPPANVDGADVEAYQARLAALVAEPAP